MFEIYITVFISGRIVYCTVRWKMFQKKKRPCPSSMLQSILLKVYINIIGFPLWYSLPQHLCMDNLLQEFKGVFVHLDDIILTRLSTEDHLQNLDRVLLTKLASAGLKSTSAKAVSFYPSRLLPYTHGNGPFNPGVKYI